MKKFFEEISRVGLIGLVFGSGDVSKRNFVGSILIILLAVAFVSAWKGNFGVVSMIVTLFAVLFSAIFQT